MAGAHLPLLGLEPVGGEPLMSVTRAWPVRRQVYGYLPSRKASPPIGWYQIILLGDRDTNVRKHAHCNAVTFLLPSISLRLAFQSRRLPLDNIFVPLPAVSW